MKNFLQLIIVLAISLPAGNIYTQEQISGRIIDTDGNDLFGANIMVYDGDRFLRGTATNDSGKFSIKIKETEKVKVTSLGYEDQFYDLEELKFDNLLIMENQAYNLPEVVVMVYGNRRTRGYRCCCCGPVRDDKYEIELKVGFGRNVWKNYPNPSNGITTVESNIERNGVIEVVAGNGQLVTSIAINGFKKTLNLTNYPSGTYYLRYRNEKEEEYIGEVVKID